MIRANLISPQTTTIMVVDDDDVSRMLGCQALRQCGFNVIEAGDGDEALRLLDHAGVDLILLDVDMPKLDGYRTCALLRESPLYRVTPVVMMTAHNDQLAIESAFVAGATDFVSKPVQWTILVHRIRYMIRSSQTLAELSRAQHLAQLGSWVWHIGSQAMAWSDETFRILGVAPGDRRPSIDALLAAVHPNDRDRLGEELRNAIQEVRGFTITHRIERPDGEGRVVNQQIEPALDGTGRVQSLSGVMQDVTERENSAAKIRKLAYFDSLTDLLNRESFRLRLQAVVAQARRHARAAAVIYLDLDDFKRVNDSLGHTAGDQLLLAVADRLRQQFRSEDAVSRLAYEDEELPAARLGGDEFAILLGEIRSASDVSTVVERLQEALSEPVTVRDQVVFVTSSIGIAVYPEDGEDSETLLRHADLAMYHAKRAGKNNFRFFNSAMNDSAQRRLTLDHQMRQAIRNNEFKVVYQPQVHLATETIGGAEALLRWNNPELGEISPTEFIPVAEDNGMILQIGEWVLRTACMQMQVWRDQGVVISRVAVNVSVLQFTQRDFAERVGAILDETALPGECLELEITESLLAKDADGAIETLNQLKALGVSLSIDDFGTGYSSLSYLKRFPIDRLKIDRCFVMDLVSDAGDMAIVSAILGMAGGMNLKVTAEGVETGDQAALLRDKGCDELQGYLISHPVSPDELAAQVRAQTSLGRRRSIKREATRSSGMVGTLPESEATAQRKRS